jgi:COP9 signalosome complex subunit 7
MEDEDPHALLDTDAAIQPYLDVLKGVNDAGIVRAMILKALSDPQVFCGFDQIQVACGNHLDDRATVTLELFSFGTFGDYMSDTSKFLPLNDTQIFKLRQLTILSCVQQALKVSSSISYSVLEQALQCPLEPILIPCLYARILNGKLCQKTKRFLWTIVPPCISRDVPMANLDTMLATLTGLQQRLQTSQGGLQTAHSFVSDKLEQSNSYWQSVKERNQKAQSQAKGNRSAWSSADSAGASPQPVPPQGVGAASRRSSASRQSKRSRGGLGGSFTEPFQRY